MNTETIVQKFREVRNYVERNEQELRDKYGTNYIAVLNNQVLGHGNNTGELWLKINNNRRKEDWAVVGTIDGILGSIMKVSNIR